MINSLSGVGLQAILTSCNPTFVWDAFRAGTCIGKSLTDTGRIDLTIVDNDARGDSVWLRWSDNKLELMSDHSGTDLGKEILFGPCGEFYGGTTTGTVTFWNLTNMLFSEVSPTTSSSIVIDTGNFPDILKEQYVHCDRFYLDSDYDLVNDTVIERTMSRSATYNRHYYIFVKQSGGTDPTGIVELGWNATSGTRTTEAPWIRRMPNSDWYMCGIIVPNGLATGYGSVKIIAGNGEWDIACASMHNIYTEHERIPRTSVYQSYERGKWDVHTTNAELKLKSCGWIAMSIVLPDRSVSNGHTDFAGAASYDFGGIFNLDCGTYRLRVSMSGTYDQVVVNLGDTSGVNFAYLSGLTDWNDFAAIGLVACWEINNGNKYATLYINGEKLDSAYNPVDWYPDDLATGTAYIGISGADGSPAEAWISRVAYGTNPLHRSYARTLSYEMKKLCRGAQS
jgi:hypothetical protein